MPARDPDGRKGYFLYQPTHEAIGRMIGELLKLREWKKAVLKAYGKTREF